MTGSEKRDNAIQIRFTDSEFKALTKASILFDRTIADAAHHLVTTSLFGLVSRIDDCESCSKQTNRD